MTTKSNFQLTPQIGTSSTACLGCGQLAVITLAWYDNIVLAPTTLALLSDHNPPQQKVVGKEMFSLCLHCLQRERYCISWDNLERLPQWEKVEGGG